MKPKVALIVGHSELSQGAVASDGTTEWVFNGNLAAKVKEYLTVAEGVLYYRMRGLGELIDRVNRKAPAFAVSFHANAFNRKATGTETLYYHSSTPSARLAQLLQQAMVGTLRLPDRGTKPRSSEDRGGYLLSGLRCPVALIEPFFIDNTRDLHAAVAHFDTLARAIAGAIDAYAAETHSVMDDAQLGDHDV
jgi:N-acetylmuramoyl-L-alanine amidase